MGKDKQSTLTRQIPGSKLMRICSIEDVELKDWVVNHGLPAYDPYTLRPLNKIDLENGIPIDGATSDYTSLERLQDSFFRLDDLLRFAKEHSLNQCLRQLENRYPELLVGEATRPQIDIDEEHLKRIAREAKQSGFIRIFHLLGILMREESYIDAVPNLPEDFFIHYFRGSNLRLTEYNPNKQSFWMCLFRRWLGLEPDRVKKRMHHIRYIPCYQYDTKTGDWEILDRKEHEHDMSQYFDDYIKLSEFAEYIKSIEEIYQIQFPFPKLLYSDEVHKGSTVSKEPKTIAFPCKPGTKWEDITMTLIANNMLRLKTPQGEGRFTYHDLGMKDIRKGDQPKVIWSLLVCFAIEGGVISSENMEYNSRLVDHAKRLNKHLKNLFEINDSIYQAHYKRENAYKTKITFKNETIYKTAKEFLKR